MDAPPGSCFYIYNSANYAEKRLRRIQLNTFRSFFILILFEKVKFTKPVLTIQQVVLSIINIISLLERKWVFVIFWKFKAVWQRRVPQLGRSRVAVRFAVPRSHQTQRKYFIPR